MIIYSANKDKNKIPFVNMHHETINQIGNFDQFIRKIDFRK
jgi:hypothetical protein